MKYQQSIFRSSVEVGTNSTTTCVIAALSDLLDKRIKNLIAKEKPSVQLRRLNQEIKHLMDSPSDEYKAGPLNNDMHTWHFSLRGPPDSEFQEGVYHGKIIFPYDYPHSPPDIYFLSKSGRFEVNQKICLTITGFHSEQWNSSWTVRTIMEGLISMFTEKEKVQSVGSLNQTAEQRKIIAANSWNYDCEKCGSINNVLKKRENKQILPQVDPGMNLQIESTTLSQQQLKKNQEQLLQTLNSQLLEVANSKGNSILKEEETKRQQQNHQKEAHIQQKAEINPVNVQYGFEWVLENLKNTTNVLLSLRKDKLEAEDKDKEIKKAGQIQNLLPSSNNSSKDNTEQIAEKNEVLKEKQQILTELNKVDNNIQSNNNSLDNSSKQSQDGIDSTLSNKINDINSETNNLEKQPIPHLEHHHQAHDADDEQQRKKDEEICKKKIRRIDLLIFLTLLLLVLYSALLFKFNV